MTKAKQVSKPPVNRRKRQTQEEKKLEYMCQHLPLMELMRDLSPQQCETLMPFVKTSAHDALCNCVYNAIFNYKSFSPEQRTQCIESMKSKLDNYKFLGNQSNTVSKKRLKQRESYLEQSGSGFPAILAAVLPLLGNLIAGR